MTDRKRNTKKDAKEDKGMTTADYDKMIQKLSDEFKFKRVGFNANNKAYTTSRKLSGARNLWKRDDGRNQVFDMANRLTGTQDEIKNYLENFGDIAYDPVFVTRDNAANNKEYLAELDRYDRRTPVVGKYSLSDLDSFCVNVSGPLKSVRVEGKERKTKDKNTYLRDTIAGHKEHKKTEKGTPYTKVGQYDTERKTGANLGYYKNLKNFRGIFVPKENIGAPDTTRGVENLRAALMDLGYSRGEADTLIDESRKAMVARSGRATSPAASGRARKATNL